MTERELSERKKVAHAERSTEEIRRDIAEGEKKISRTVEKIDERFKQKLDWRKHIKKSPYLALGAAAGLGYIATRMFMTSKTPLERIMGSVADELHDTLGGLRARSADQGIIKVTLLAIATKTASDWIKRAATTAVESSCAGPGPQTEQNQQSDRKRI